jgi:hypothetical protein
MFFSIEPNLFPLFAIKSGILSALFKVVVFATFSVLKGKAGAFLVLLLQVDRLRVKLPLDAIAGREVDGHDC